VKNSGDIKKIIEQYQTYQIKCQLAKKQTLEITEKLKVLGVSKFKDVSKMIEKIDNEILELNKDLENQITEANKILETIKDELNEKDN
jgi:hypothetical protein